MPELGPRGPCTLAECGQGRSPGRLGAQLVHLAEELYLRLVRVGSAILLIGCALTLLFATLDYGAPGTATSLFVAGAAGLGVAGCARPGWVYLLLRSRRSLQVGPAAYAAVAVLVDGPDSPCWWFALPLLWIVAAVSSTWLAVGAAFVTALAFLAGTVLGGQALIGPHDSGVLPTAVGLVAYTLVGRVLIDGFAGLVLGRERLTPTEQQQTPSPVRVPNLAASPPAENGGRSPVSPPAPAARRSSRSASRLTARQLQVALLLGDGLRQTEIAACLGISARQVERLIAAARERVGATTTSELVAMLARGALAGP